MDDVDLAKNLNLKIMKNKIKKLIHEHVIAHRILLTLEENSVDKAATEIEALIAKSGNENVPKSGIT